AAEKITGVLNHATIPTYTYINSNAGSAGAIIALATRHIYMAPVSAIGAAAPILSSGQDLPPTEKEKAISYWSALVRGSALRNGHNPDIGEAFMNKDKEVKIGNKVVHPKGTLLSLNAQEATQKFNGKPLLADGIANSLGDLVQQAGLKGAIVRLDPTGFEQLAFWLTTLSPLLLLGGIIGAYLEFKIPGFGIAGIVSIICFALFFLGHYFAGLAGWETVALFILGFVFVIIEVLFFGHSTIIVGVVGVLLMLASLLWAMIDRYPGQGFFPTGAMLKIPVTNLFLTFLVAAAIIAVLARFLPRTSIYRRFILSTTNPPGPSLGEPARSFVSATPIAPGMRGRSLTILRPSGKAQFDDRVVDVVTEGEFIAPETPIAVISTDGMRVIVKGIVA
ncbi:MAG TPA: hypothetical protein VHW03_02220, partial [Chthoniobacterales bacterium]|nr:hypothetical protein [Chthoniobacterales bacterium]